MGKPAQQDMDLLVLLKLICPEELSIILCCSCKHKEKVNSILMMNMMSGFYLAYTFSNLQLKQSRSYCNIRKNI